MTNDTRLILFDIDGTLLRTPGLGRDAKRLAMLEFFGTEGSLDSHDFGGKTDWQILADLLQDHGYSAEEVGQRMPAYEQVMARHMQAILADYEGFACAGAMELLQELRQRKDMLLGIVTGNTSQTAPIKLRLAGFSPQWFPVGAYGSEALSRNDLPALAIRRAEQHTGQAIHSEQVIVVGDTPADIECARTVGAMAVAVCTGYAPHETLVAAKPDVLLDDLTTFLDTVLSG